MLFIIILTIVLSGSVWAEERFYLDRNDGPIVLFRCDDGLTRCVEPRTGEVMGCYQRMREAMTTLDDILKHRWVQTFSGVNAHETIFQALAERAQWDQTIKACVEGK